MTEKLSYRESAFLIIFENMFLNKSAEELFEIAGELDNIDLGNKTRKLVSSIIDNSKDINDTIQRFSEKRAFSRIPKLHVAAISIGVAEILYDEKIPTNVAVSEAIKLVKKYGLETDVKFVNGVLGAFSRSL